MLEVQHCQTCLLVSGGGRAADRSSSKPRLQPKALPATIGRILELK